MNLLIGTLCKYTFRLIVWIMGCRGRGSSCISSWLSTGSRHRAASQTHAFAQPGADASHAGPRRHAGLRAAERYSNFFNLRSRKQGHHGFSRVQLSNFAFFIKRISKFTWLRSLGCIQNDNKYFCKTLRLIHISQFSSFVFVWRNGDPQFYVSDDF